MGIIGMLLPLIIIAIAGIGIYLLIKAHKKRSSKNTAKKNEPISQTPPTHQPTQTTEANKPKVCTGCGGKLDEGAIFCNNCGTKPS